MGQGARLSTATNVTSATIPVRIAAVTAGWRKPTADDSVKP